MTTSPLRIANCSGFYGDRIEAAAKKSYVYKTYLKNDSIKTKSQDGVVTLTGTVSEPAHVSLAQDTVESLPGVRSVDNQLKVKAGEAAEHSDTWISLKVRTTLLFHRNVSVGTGVSVKDGVVTLTGEAASLAQKDLTTEYAKDIDNDRDSSRRRQRWRPRQSCLGLTLVVNVVLVLVLILIQGWRLRLRL